MITHRLKQPLNVTIQTHQYTKGSTCIFSAATIHNKLPSTRVFQKQHHRAYPNTNTQRCGQINSANLMDVTPNNVCSTLPSGNKTAVDVAHERDHRNKPPHYAENPPSHQLYYDQLYCKMLYCIKCTLTELIHIHKPNKVATRSNTYFLASRSYFRLLRAAHLLHPVLTVLPLFPRALRLLVQAVLQTTVTYH